jgi:cytochrome c oxidase subunit 4
MIHHIVPKKTYFAVFIALLLLTAVTIEVAFVDLGVLNNIVALSIAVFKALLVVLFFMHVRWSNKLTQVVVASGFLWLAILVAFTLGDYFTRGLLGVPGK